MNELALFAGSGGGILGGHLLGWRTVGAVERDAYSAQVLAQRQNDGALPAFPIWSDVCSFDGRPWRGLVDVVSGGFPCQDISVAGNGAGIDGARSGLWREMARIIGEVRPKKAYLENSPLLVGRGLAVVLGDLAEMGYDAQWCIVSASDCGAPHQRDRCWLVANDNRARQPQPAWQQQECRLGAEFSREALADSTGTGRKERGFLPSRQSQAGQPNTWQAPERNSRWPVEPRMGRVADGVAHRVDRIKALGNGQVPRVAATAFPLLSINND
ncbi:DNA cytosine methyltransferase [Pseudomonas sp. CHM02]|uniref:DNA cytosine methyltransferase n=1 Tax=Pseudomonas sp. CHM02 TaxID=1463662 RepID=UPI000470124E|nr:DNA cytosine methyltransferase [Pseudomonas sp. CHM02]